MISLKVGAEFNITSTQSQMVNICLMKDQFYGWVRWDTFVIPFLRRQRQVDHKFEANLDYMLSLRPSWAI
jgi:hypothetical protein